MQRVEIAKADASECLSLPLADGHGVCWAKGKSDAGQRYAFSTNSSREIYSWYVNDRVGFVFGEEFSLNNAATRE